MTTNFNELPQAGERQDSDEYALVRDGRTMRGTIANLIAGLTAPVANHRKYAAVREADNSFVIADFTAALVSSTSDTGEITLPVWAAGNRYLAIAQPLTETPYTDMRERGSPFNARNSFDIHMTGDSETVYAIENVDHRVYIYDAALLQSASGDVWELA